MSDYEIDHGDPKPVSATRPVPVVPEADMSEARRQDVARATAAARIEGAARQRHIVDMLALAVAGLCGQGLGGASRVDPWTGGATLGMLATVAGLAAAAWMWRRSRHVAEALWMTPVPLDETTIRKLALQDDAKRDRERQRRDEEFARIELLDGELTLFCRRMRLAAWGAGAGSLCAWICAAAGPVGSMPLAASVAALPGAILGWRIAGGGWSAQLVQRTAIAVLPGTALVAAIALEAPPIPAVGGASVVAAAGWWWRTRLSGLAGCIPESAVTPAG